MKKKWCLLLTLVTFLSPVYNLVACSKKYNDKIIVQEENLLLFVKEQINLAFKQFAKDSKNFVINNKQIISNDKIIQELNTFANNQEQKNYVLSQENEIFEKIIQYIDNKVIKSLNNFLQNGVTSFSKNSNVVKISSTKSGIELKHNSKVNWNNIKQILNEKEASMILEKPATFEFALNLNFQINLGNSKNYDHRYNSFEFFLVTTKPNKNVWVEIFDKNISKNLKFNLETWNFKDLTNKLWKEDLLKELKNINVTNFTVSESNINVESYEMPSIGNFFDRYSVNSNIEEDKKTTEISEFSTLLKNKTKEEFFENLLGNIELSKDFKNNNPLYNREKDDDDFLKLGFVTLKIKQAKYQNFLVDDFTLEKVPLILRKSKFKQNITDIAEVLFEYFSKIFTISDAKIKGNTNGITDRIILKINQEIWENYPERETDKNTPLISDDANFKKMISIIAKESSEIYKTEIGELWSTNSDFKRLASSIKTNIKNGVPKESSLTGSVKENWRFSVYHFNLDLQISYFKLNLKVLDKKLIYFATLINDAFCDSYHKEKCVKPKTLTPISNTDSITMV